MRKLYETVLILIGTIGWWGFVYPDLCITEEVYEQECEEEQEESAVSEQAYPKEISAGSEMLDAESAEDAGTEQSGWKIGNIRIKSRVAEYLYQER